MTFIWSLEMDDTAHGTLNNWFVVLNLFTIASLVYFLIFFKYHFCFGHHYYFQDSGGGGLL